MNRRKGIVGLSGGVECCKIPPVRFVFPLKVVANLRPPRGEDTKLVVTFCKPESVIVTPAVTVSVAAADERTTPELKIISFGVEDASNVA